MTEQQDTTKTSATHVVDELRETFQAPSIQPKTPLEQFSQSISKLQVSIRQQQMASEQQLQSTLSQASTYAADSQSIDNIYALAQQLQQIIAQGSTAILNNAPKVKEIITQLSSLIQEQGSKIDTQVAISLIQAVSSMAQAQLGTYQSQVFKEAAQLLKQGEQAFGQLQNPSQLVQ